MKPKFDITEFEIIDKNKLVFECENCGKDFLGIKKNIKRYLGITKNKARCTLNFCSKKCSDENRKNGKTFECTECGKELYRSKREIDINNQKNFFCSHRCRGSYWNRNKEFGSNRSKIELVLEEELINRYNLKFVFNSRQVLDSGYELDIYIPEIRLAFEINGVFHYEEIFGKLKITQEKDLSKINECKEKNIELIVVDISQIKHFNCSKHKYYIDFIFDKIDSKIGSDLDDYIYHGERKFIQKNKNIKYCSCGKEIKKTSLNCLKCRNNRKVERPTYENLLKDINDIGYKKTGEKYNVDRTTIYKWVDNYKKMDKYL